MRAAVLVSLADKDVGIVDEQTMEWECDCGASLELVHLADYDLCKIWFGGICGKCGRDLEIDAGYWE